MQVQLRHQPSFSVARCLLAPGEPVRVEAGAMLATSWGVAIQAAMQGGLLKGLRRSVLGGESLYVTTYTAPEGGGWVDVAAHLPGDVAVIGGALPALGGDPGRHVDHRAVVEAVGAQLLHVGEPGVRVAVAGEIGDQQVEADRPQPQLPLGLGPVADPQACAVAAA